MPCRILSGCFLEIILISEIKELFLLLQAIPEVLTGVHYNDVAMVTKALNVVGQAIDSMKQTLKLMHGNIFR